MLLKFISVTILMLPVTLSAQDCTCSSNFEWVVKTFSENDAGFAYALDRKGENIYKEHTAAYTERVKTISDREKCQRTIYEWMTFFRNGHIAIVPTLKPSDSGEKSVISDEEIKKRYADWERVALQEDKFQTYLAEKETMDYEGIWLSPPYRIAIQRNGNEYIGSILSADGVYWQQGQVKLRIAEDDSSVFYMRDHSAQEIPKTTMIGKNILQFGNIELERENADYSNEPWMMQYRKAVSSRVPYLERLNESTLYLRIPSFRFENKVVIDSVLAANHDLINSTENLIIDIRFGTGGSDQSYYGILPYVYTQPIRSVGVEFLSTELNNSRMLEFAQDTEIGLDEETKQWARTAYEKLTPRLGEFVNVDTTAISIQTYDQIYEFPKKVGVIMHQYNGSTDEEFLLAVRQSQKVKLFGTSTQGVLDISNMMYLSSPCEEFKLGYSLSKSLRIPDLAIDGMGIQPDYYLDASIPAHEWVNYVSKVLAQ